MAHILNRVSWVMQRRFVQEDKTVTHKPWFDDVTIRDDDDDDRPLTKREWRTRVNPAGPWELHYNFDARGLPNIESVDGAMMFDVEWTRAGSFGGVILFDADATVRDALGAIAALPVRYGYLCGFCKLIEGDRTMYVLQYGT